LKELADDVGFDSYQWKAVSIIEKGKEDLKKCMALQRNIQ